MLELYHHNTSVCAAKVRLTLAEKALDWQGHYIDIIAGEQYTAEFAALNPKCEVPVLVHDGKVVRESALIDEYLDEEFPEISLSPEDHHARHEMRLWAKIPDDGIHLACADLTFAVHHRNRIIDLPEAEQEALVSKTRDPSLRERKWAAVRQGFDAPAITTAVKRFEAMLDDMNDQLEKTEWLAGDRYTLADIALTPYVNRIWMFGYGEGWADDRPHLSRWFDAIRAKPNFQSAVTGWLPDDLIATMRANGDRNRTAYFAAAAA